jgi:hypothetical protein
MNQDNLLELVINKIRDQRYLFLIALVLLVGSLSIFANKTGLGVLVLVAGFLLVATENLLVGRGSRLSVALKFPSSHDPSTMNLVKCIYSFADPRDPGEKKTGEVLPYRAGGGWLCPLPLHMKPSDIIDLTFSDNTGQEWVVRRFVPELSWPILEVQPK